MGKVEFKLDDIQLKANIAEFGPEINKRITVTMDKGASLGTAEMKKKAPWTDRTTNARSGLNTSSEHTGSGPIGFTTHSMTLAHGVDYGIWLEIRDPNHGGRPIIVPTMLALGKQIMAVLSTVLNDVGPSAPNVSVPTANVQRGKTGARQRAEAAHARSKGTKRTKTTRRTPRV